MASEVQNLRLSLGVGRKLVLAMRTGVNVERKRINDARPAIVGPLKGASVADEVNAYLAGAEDSLRQAIAKVEAANRRMERAINNAAGL